MKSRKNDSSQDGVTKKKTTTSSGVQSTEVLKSNKKGRTLRIRYSQDKEKLGTGSAEAITSYDVKQKYTLHRKGKGGKVETPKLKKRRGVEGVYMSK